MRFINMGAVSALKVSAPGYSDVRYLVKRDGSIYAVDFTTDGSLLRDANVTTTQELEDGTFETGPVVGEALRKDAEDCITAGFRGVFFKVSHEERACGGDNSQTVRVSVLEWREGHGTGFHRLSELIEIYGRTFPELYTCHYKPEIHKGSDKSDI